MSERSPFNKIISVNLIVLLAYAIAIKLFATLSGGGEEQMTYVILIGLASGAHVLLDLLVALILGLAGKRDASLGFLASAPLVLLIGAGVCFGGAAVDLSGVRSR